MTEKKNKKVGVFHNTELDFISQHKDTMTIEAMAEHLNRSVESVKKALFKVDTTAKERELKKEFERELKTRPYWPNLVKQYDTIELNLFEHHWIKYTQQFKDDITHAEEMQIIKAIDLEMLIERAKLQNNEAEKGISILQKALDEELDKDDASRDKNYIISITQQLSATRAAVQSGVKTHLDLIDKYQKIMRDLKSTRDQRLKDVENRDITFFGWLKKFSDHKIREKVSKDAELMKHAVEKLRGELGNYYKYEDNDLDRPLLNSDTVLKEEETE